MQAESKRRLRMALVEVADDLRIDPARIPIIVEAIDYACAKLGVGTRGWNQDLELRAIAAIAAGVVEAEKCGAGWRGGQDVEEARRRLFTVIDGGA